MVEGVVGHLLSLLLLIGDVDPLLLTGIIIRTSLQEWFIVIVSVGVVIENSTSWIPLYSHQNLEEACIYTCYYTHTLLFLLDYYAYASVRGGRLRVVIEKKWRASKLGFI